MSGQESQNEERAVQDAFSVGPNAVEVDAATRQQTEKSVIEEESAGDEKKERDRFGWLYRGLRSSHKVYLSIGLIYILYVVFRKCKEIRSEFREGCGTKLVGIGDGYCDCETDGRDEALFASSGCSGPLSLDFECRGALVPPFRVARSKVGDGIIDCCDGSDEGKKIRIDFTQANSACYAALEAKVAHLELLMLQTVETQKIRQTATERAKVLAAEARDAVDQIRPWVTATQERIAMTTSHSERNYLQHQLRSLLVSMTPQTAAAEARADIYGADGAWLSLLGQCFDSLPLSDKQTLGGISSIEPESYIFRFCPFANITQRRLPSSKDEPLPEEVLLGKFRSWMGPVTRNKNGRYGPRPRKPATARLFNAQNRGDLAVGDARVPGHLQLYDGGATCVGNKPRHVIIDSICAPDNALVAVDEDGTCNYVFDFETPLACSNDIPQLARSLRKLRATLRFPSALILPRIIHTYARRFLLRAIAIFSADDPASIFIPLFDAVKGR